MELLNAISFGNEAGDDADPIEILSYFVEQQDFSHFTDKSNKLQIITAKKGVGKSALIKWAGTKIEEHDDSPIVIQCRGADLVRSNFKISDKRIETPNEYITDWRIRICALVNRQIAKQISFALDDDDITLIETAEIDGYKSKNLVSSLTSRFTKALDRFTPTARHSENELELLKRKAKTLAESDKKVWILIDDLDATFQKTEAGLLELSTFFSACRYLTQDLRDVYIRVTLRTDVWKLIRRYDESLDKVDQYVHEIRWKEEDFKQLLHLRVKSAVDQYVYPHPRNPDGYLSRVFSTEMNWGDKITPSYRVIFTLAYGRPRWAIQLCKLSQKNAIKQSNPKIGDKDIFEILTTYSKQKINDIVSEHKHQCKDIEEIITGFRGSKSLMNTNELMKWINNHIVNHMTPIIEDKAVKTPKDIAHFLYRTGFIIGRKDNETGYEHFLFEDIPDLLSSRTDSDFNMSWEIHPCFRQALDIRSLSAEQRRNSSRFPR